jgi:hypothetical protein
VAIRLQAVRAAPAKTGRPGTEIPDNFHITSGGNRLIIEFNVHKPLDRRSLALRLLVREHRMGRCSATRQGSRIL